LRNADPDGDQGSVELIGAALPSLKQERRDGLHLGRRTRDHREWLCELDELWQARAEGDLIFLEGGVWAPLDRAPNAARPHGSRFGKAGSLPIMPLDPVGDPRDVAMSLHIELDEELTTLELMARNSYEHPDMPWAFHRDMLRQVSDEARHARLIARALAARGFRHGDFQITTSSYNGLYAFEPCEPFSRKELLWRLLIRQTFMEGLAVDHLPQEIERRRAAGQDDIAQMFDFILRDEVFHAQSGLRWSRELLGPDPKAMIEERQAAVDYFTARAEAAREAFVMENLDEAMGELALIEAIKQRRGGARPKRPINRMGRRQAGYTQEDIDQLIGWGYASSE
jgi:uncharacterized ferritin-like protein (DUF455 family)